MTMDVTALYHQAREQEATEQTGHEGFYNRNIRLTTEEGHPVVVRMRKPGADTEVMDPRLWPEQDVLTAIAPYVTSAPRLLHANKIPDFQIHAHIEGHLLADLAPDGTPLPGPVLPALESLFTQLLRVPREVLPPLPADWPADRDTPAFALTLLNLVREIRHRGDERINGLYDSLGIPKDPCATLEARATTLAPRPFRLLHADIHRKNVILTPDGQVAFLDWELALWADPVHDLADHIHKMSYTSPDRAAMLDAWERAAPPECREQWREDLDFYLAYQATKSAVVDTVRWGRHIAEERGEGLRRSRAGELAGKLAAARPHWGVAVSGRWDAGEVLSRVDYWMSKR